MCRLYGIHAAFLISLILLAFPSFAVAQIVPDLTPSWCQADAGHFVLTPAGSAPSLVEYGVQVELWLIEVRRGPIADFPRQDVFLYHDGRGTLFLCPGGSSADADTDLEGYTTVSGPIYGGGSVEEGVMLMVLGHPVAQTPGGDDYVLPLSANSPDINGDRSVGISDITLFVEDLQAYAFRSDFNNDGEVDLSDITTFTNHIGESCP